MRSVILALALAVAPLMAGAAQIGADVSGELGINNSGGPFDPGFFQQIDFGTATIDAGVEFPAVFGGSFDFGDGSLSASFNVGAADLPFNGYIFTFSGLTRDIVGFNFLGGTVSNISQANLSFTQNQIAIDLNGSVVGTGNFEIVLADIAPVPLPQSALLLLGGLGLLGIGRAREAA